MDEAFLSEIVTTYYQEYLKQFAARYSSELEQNSSGLVPLIERAIGRLNTFETAWHFSVAAARDAVVDGATEDKSLCIAVSLGIAALQSLGIDGEFQAASRQPLTPLWQGRLLRPVTRTAAGISVDRGAIASKTIDIPVTTSLFNSEGWHDNACVLPSVRSEHIKIELLTAAAANWIGCESPGELSEGDMRLAQQMFVEATDLIEKHAPKFAPWVGRVLRYVSPIEAPTGVMRSGSGRQWPGVAEISYRCDAIAIAEMLIHEATHQYYNILLMLEPVADGSDRRLYYSPVRRCERPIEMILLAYHAFANVLLFYRECQSSGLSDNGFCQRNEQELLPDLKDLETSLRATSSLTEVGNSLWRPLTSQIN